jgi:hypothetical protein
VTVTGGVGGVETGGGELHRADLLELALDDDRGQVVITS